MKSILLVASLLVLFATVDAFEPRPDHFVKIDKHHVPIPRIMCPIGRRSRRFVNPHHGEDPFAGCIPWDIEPSNIGLKVKVVAHDEDYFPKPDLTDVFKRFEKDEKEDNVVSDDNEQKPKSKSKYVRKNIDFWDLWG